VLEDMNIDLKSAKFNSVELTLKRIPGYSFLSARRS
jgi:hypothetical protein